MRRYFILSFLLLVTIPFDLSVVGCGARNNEKFCNQAGFGQTNTAITNIHLDPELTGISLAYSQTSQLASPTSTNCNGGSVAVGAYIYTSSDSSLIDVSPTGQLCAGTWNRTTGGGVPAFTTCLPANKTGVAYVTADADGKSSNKVSVYIHPTVTSLSLDVTNTQTGQTSQQSGASNGCYSQNQTAQLNATAFVAGNTKTPFCAPNSGNPNVPDCTVNLGHLTYSPVSASIVSIDQNGLATAQQPGSTVVSATIAGTSSNAGYFYTCPPKSIAISGISGASNINVTPNTPQALNAVVTDTNGKAITGLTLSYTSTNPQNIGVTGSGSVSSSFPSSSAVYAVCQPPSCNPSPINQIGINGNGAPIVSNSVGVSSPGNVSSFVWMASPLSQYFVPADLTAGTTGTPVRLPYPPNSMVLDQAGTSLYFGSYRELMIYSAANNAFVSEDINVPGVVLAVSADGSTVLVNDRQRGVFYLYSPANKTSTSTFGGVGQRAVFTPDGATVYITGQDSTGKNVLYIHNIFTGWAVESLNSTTTTTCLPPSTNTDANTDANTAYNLYCSPDVALTVPGVAAFVSGATTTAGTTQPAGGTTGYGFCPDTRQTPVNNYPLAATLPLNSDHLVSTFDGKHVLSATANPAVFSDTGITVPASACPTAPLQRPDGTTVNATVPLQIPSTAPTPISLDGYGIKSVDQVVAAPDSSIAFVTYTGTATTTPAGGALLPAYKIPAQPGTAVPLSPVVLSGSATAPLVGIFSTDYQSFFVGTAGDNLLHIISTSTLKDVRQIAPHLPDANGNPTAVQLIATKPRATT